MSKDWAIVSQHCLNRRRELIEELTGVGYDHSPGLDDARRARLAEIDLILSLTSPKP
jgi:hypothetical protein